VVVLYLVIFWVMQAGAQVLFKCGTVFPGKYVLFFVLGNLPGASSILFLMQLYKIMNPNLALALGTGGGFLACQIALALIFRSSLSLPQYASMIAIAAGMFGFTLFNKG
jgi:multidrug transporter EmrE-like cation transporter